MSPYDVPLSPDVLLRQAARGDAARAQELLADVASTKLLDAVLTQAELAADDDRRRLAGIDAIAELHRAAIEVMDLPQPSLPGLSELAAATDWSLDFGAIGSDAVSSSPPDDHRGATRTEDPTLVGWELATVAPSELEAATVTLEARPWQIALVAFADTHDTAGVRSRRVVAAAADGRILAARLRYNDAWSAPDVLDAVVSTDTDDLAADASLASGLLASLRQAARRG
ncbi:MAG: hypothetical protein WD358_05780 [Nitriliruptoraceae bacterium]